MLHELLLKVICTSRSNSVMRYSVPLILTSYFEINIVAYFYTPVTLESERARMPSEWKFVVHSWIFEVYSKNSECIPNIGAHSCDRPECFYHAKNIRGAFKVEKDRTAFELHADCILSILTGRYGILTIFETFWSPSNENRNGKPLQILPECPKCASNEPECISNAFRLLPEFVSRYYNNSVGMQFKCLRNLSIAPRMRLDFSRNVPIGPRMSPDVIQNTAESHI